MIYKPFSVVVVPFPFTDSSNVKRRPAIVLSSEEFQKQTEHVTLMMITSSKHNHWYGDHELMDLKETGLKVDSIIRQKIFTLDVRLILDCIGKISVKDKQVFIKNTQKHLKSVLI